MVTTVAKRNKAFCALLTLLMSMVGAKTMAYDAKVNGIYYIFSGTTATVTYYSDDGIENGNAYSGSVVIPNTVRYNGVTYTVTSINYAAFRFCSGMTSLTIPNSVTYIGAVAFGGCTGLTSLTIPNSVTYIATYAFSACSNLTSLTIGNSITHMEEKVCNGCSKLTSVKVPVTDYNTFCSNEVVGLIASRISKPIVLIDIYGNEIKEYVIPGGVTSIGNSAFSYCSGLTSVTIPNSVTSIGSSAFRYCIGLTSVTIPNSVASIGNYAFASCSGLTSMIIPNSVISIGNSAFASCSGLTSVTIPNSVTGIAYRTFYGCSNLTSVTIGNSVTYIGALAFENCIGLTSVTIPSAVTSIGMESFKGTGVYNNAPNGVFYVDTWACGHKGAIPNNLILRDGTLGISDDAFSFTGITSVNIPNSVKIIGYEAFLGCSSLTSVTIPNSVISIGQYAFQQCHGLTSVTIPSIVTSIGKDAFYDCSNLTSVTAMMEIPVSIGSTTFSNRQNATLYIPYGCKTAYEAADYWKEFKEIVEMPAPAIIFADASVKALCVDNWDSNGDGELDKAEAAAVMDIRSVFRGNTTITAFDELQCFTGLTSIGHEAFYGCSGLTSVTIPSSVTSISSLAFEDCSSLTSVTIPSSVTSIDSYAFRGCSGLFSIMVNSANSKFDSRNNCNAIIETATNTLITGCMNTVIPSTVTSIGWGAFAGCSSLTSLTIPSSVTSIGGAAFAGCSGLTSVTIPDGVTSISYNAFRSCSGLTSVTIPSSVTSISTHAFEDCSSLTSVTIPSSVTGIADGAFSGCSSLSSITVMNGNSEYDSRNNCNAIIETASNTLVVGCKNTIIPNTVTSIGDFAFYNCSGLASVDIPSSVTGIGDFAFKGCNVLTNVKVGMETPLTINSYTFTNRQNATLYVPYGSKAAYEAANYWKDFKKIIELPKPVDVTDISQLGDAIYIVPLSARIGGEVQMAICLKNAQTATAYNFELVLPEGVTVARNAQGSYNDVLSDRHDDHTRIFNNKGNNTYGFATLSGNSEPLAGNDGAIRLVTLAVDETAAEGVYPIIIQNATYSKPDGSIVTLPETTTTITLENYILGDVNGNNGVDIGDAVTIVNYLVGKETSNFVEKAADMNKNGGIDIGDAVTIVNFLVGKTTSLSRQAETEWNGHEPQ